MPVAEIEQADAIVIVGSQLRHELPLLHARIRKAVQRGAKVHVVNPVDFDFTFDIASKHIVPPSQLAAAIANVQLGDASHAVIIVGNVAETGAHASAIRGAARKFASANGASLCRIPQGANAVGLARVGVLPTSRDVQSMLRDARSAYVLYGIEPGLDFADQALAMQSLGKAQVVAFSHFACQSTRAIADVILPIGTLPEIDATLTNLDGRDQRAVAGGKLPGDARPGWRVLRALGGELGCAGFDFTDLAGLRGSVKWPAASSATANDAPGANRGWFQADELETIEAAGRTASPTKSSASQSSSPGLELVFSQAIYRTDAVVRRAAALQAHPLTLGARIVLHPTDARAADLSVDSIAKVSNAVGTASLPVAISDKVAPGCIWIESGYGATSALTSGLVEVRCA
jgi:NADH-quinone oxidoreductase subunit G